ncbi:SIMPL domain-containing protein [Streptomyces sp. NPDC004539]|uniref:SIMPL domain-containing protein n=1 Tax=Streptomyces sp. NPDC004539 TaxID=3154280 RepID=UPI0033BD773C
MTNGTAEAPLLTVRGEARIETDPEVARVWVTVSARGRDRRQVLEDLTRRNSAALDLIRSYGDAVERASSGSFSVVPEPAPHGRGERVRAYHGRVRIAARLTDFTALGELVTRLADLDLTLVEGPEWELRADSAVPAEARRAAARDAVQRAREYAEALGTTLAALVELTDDEPGRAPRSRANFSRSVMQVSAAAAESAPAPLDLEPPRLTVEAAVTARLTLRPPVLNP